MAVLKDFFGHNTIHLLTSVFGSVFDDIKIKRKNDVLIRVPIRYELNKKYLTRDLENPDPDQARYKSQLPRMSFRLTSMERDPERVMDKTRDVIVRPDVINGVTGVNSQKQRVPYLFRYKLSIKTKNIIDMYQILEQVLVYFNPSLAVIVRDNDHLSEETNINIKIMATTNEEIMNGILEAEEIIEAEIDFELDGYLYMPNSTSKLITKVNVGFYENFDEDPIDFIQEVP